MLTGRRCAVCACAISLMFLHTGTRCELCSFVACSHCSHQVRPGQCSDLVSGLYLLVSPPSAPPSEFELQHGSAGDESYVGFGLLINGRHLADQVTLPIFNRNEYSLTDSPGTKCSNAAYPRLHSRRSRTWSVIVYFCIVCFNF